MRVQVPPSEQFNSKPYTMIGFTLVRLPIDMRRQWAERVSQQGNTQRKNAFRITYREVKRTGRLYLSGYSVSSISKISGCSEARVYKVLGYTGMPLWMKRMHTFNRNRRSLNQLPMGVNRYMWKHV